MELGKQLEFGDDIQDNVDSQGNRWFIDDNKVFLKLSGENFNRKIGTIKGDKLVIKRNRKEHILRVNMSYGFNIEIIDSLKQIKFVDLHEDAGMFRIPVSTLKEDGESLFHERTEFDRQLFLPISLIEYYKTIPEEDIKRIELMGESWYNVMKPEFDKDYMAKLGLYVAKRRQVTKVYPPKEQVFRAFKLTPFENVKVVIMALSPYHTDGVANGLAFSSAKPLYIPPTLKKMYEAIEKDVYMGLMLNQPVSLEAWAEQGVLLINTILTVEQGEPKSHAEKGWEDFTKAVLIALKNSSKNTVALLWGRDAQKYREFIENDRNLILEAEHPAFAAREERAWDNLDCFNKTNKYLEQKGMCSIEW